MILITGGGGFVGRNLVGVLPRDRGLRCLVRDPARAAHLKEKGCEPVRGDIRDKRTVLEAIGPEVDTVIHLVGILVEPRGATFKDIHTEGTRNVVEACVEKGVRRYLHISALGTRPNARSIYHQTKWEAEEIIRKSGLDYTIFRPSVLFGREDKFTNLFARAIRLAPVIMIPGSGRNLMQPVFVGDLVSAMAMSINMDGARKKVFELGGAQKYTFDGIIDAIARVLGRKVFKVHIPMPLMRIGAAMAEAVLPTPPITRDQLLMLEEDNVTEETAFKDVFGITPTGFEEGMRTYLQ